MRIMCEFFEWSALVLNQKYNNKIIYQWANLLLCTNQKINGKKTELLKYSDSVA
jgi:hypothetical protein